MTKIEQRDAIRQLTQLSEQLAAGPLTQVKIQQALQVLTLEALAMRERRNHTQRKPQAAKTDDGS